MAPQQPQFRFGVRVRYNGRIGREGWSDAGREMLLTTGMTGEILAGPRRHAARRGDEEREHYQIRWPCGHDLWVRGESLERT